MKRYLNCLCVALLVFWVGCDSGTSLVDNDAKSEIELGEPTVVTGFIPISEIPPGADIRELVRNHAASKTTASWSIYKVGSQIYVPVGGCSGGECEREFQYTAYSDIKVDCSLYVGTDVTTQLRERKAVTFDVIVTNNFMSGSAFLPGSCTTPDNGKLLGVYPEERKTYIVPGTFDLVRLNSTHKLYMDDPFYSTITTTVESNMTPGVYYQEKSL